MSSRQSGWSQRNFLAGTTCQGARLLVERRGRNDFEVAIDEVARGKITYELPDLADQDDDTL